MKHPHLNARACHKHAWVGPHCPLSRGLPESGIWWAAAMACRNQRGTPTARSRASLRLVAVVFVPLAHTAECWWCAATQWQDPTEKIYGVASLNASIRAIQYCTDYIWQIEQAIFVSPDREKTLTTGNLNFSTLDVRKNINLLQNCLHQ